MYTQSEPDATGEWPATARWWLLTGVAALAVAGLFALVLVVARTPQLASIPLFTRLFHEALVVHVDLSVLVWFLAVACMFWSITPARPPRFLILEKGALITFALGALVLALSPLDPRGTPLMSNYIPVIGNPPFFLGLALIFCGVALQLVYTLLRKPARAIDTPSFMLHYGACSAALITLIAFAAFKWSYLLMPPVIEGQQYYELLFWGGGHVLQLTHTQILLVAWTLLASALWPGFKLAPGVMAGLLGIGVLTACSAVFPYVRYGVETQEFRLFFTRMMIEASGIAPTVLGLLILPWLFRAPVEAKAQRALRSSLVMSLLLFVYGGVLGMLIHGQDVTIPAHYHGAIVGVTLGFMGLAYLALPRFGYAPAAQTRLAFWQPIVYGGGQLLHVSGLAWSGGYGVLRKTPGALEGGLTAAKAAMGLMGLGGLLAIIGGFMFVIVVARSVCDPSPPPVRGRI